jgi:hypothetical protein
VRRRVKTSHLGPLDRNSRPVDLLSSPLLSPLSSLTEPRNSQNTYLVCLVCTRIQMHNGSLVVETRPPHGPQKEWSLCPERTTALIALSHRSPSLLLVFIHTFSQCRARFAGYEWSFVEPRLYCSCTCLCHQASSLCHPTVNISPPGLFSLFQCPLVSP